MICSIRKSRPKTGTRKLYVELNQKLPRFGLSIGRDRLFEILKENKGKNILIVSHGGPLGITDLGSKGFSQKDIVKHYFDYFLTLTAAGSVTSADSSIRSTFSKRYFL